MLGGIFDKNNVKDKIQKYDKKITEENFWKNKLLAQKILKEKKFLEKILSDFNFTLNELENSGYPISIARIYFIKIDFN